MKHKLVDAGVHMFQTDWFSPKSEINTLNQENLEGNEGFMGGSVDGFYA